MLDIANKRCRALWLAVIHQAMMDLTSEDETEEGIVRHGEARRWFFMQSDNFNFVCGMAGLTPGIVRKRAREVETNPELLGIPHV